MLLCERTNVCWHRKNARLTAHSAVACAFLISPTADNSAAVGLGLHLSGHIPPYCQPGRLASVCHRSCGEAPPGWARRMEATRRQNPGGEEAQEQPWGSPQARARDDDILADVTRSSWQRFPSSVIHVCAVTTVW